ncbi:FtsZ family protein [Paraburkholderia sp. BL25I1N1]|nr:FtsZ family protein [Paraburkholderia sp. BL25I1N1]
MVVVSTGACSSLNGALNAERIEGDIRYLHALPKTAGSLLEVSQSDGAIAISLATMREMGLMFIVVDPQVESDLAVASSVSHAAREAGLFVVALVAQTAEPSSDGRMHECDLLRAFDSVIALRAAWPEAQPFACNIIRHISGGLKVAPPVCTDLADVQGILGGAIVTVGVGEAEGPPSTGERGRAWDAAALAILDVGRVDVAAATGVIVAIAGSHSVRLSEISRVTHQVGDLVESADALVIPTVHVEASAPDGFRVLLLVARCFDVRL